MTTYGQWRDAANGLREIAVEWDKKADEAERYAICGIVSESGPNGEPLACGYKHGHKGNHAWATLPTWTPAYGHRPAEGDDENERDQ